MLRRNEEEGEGVERRVEVVEVRLEGCRDEQSDDWPPEVRRGE